MNRRAATLAVPLVLAAAIATGVAVDRNVLQGTAAVETASERYGALQAKARANPAPHKVPYFGPFSVDGKHGAKCGPAVRLMEGALRLTQPPVRKTKAQACIGVATERQIKTFQKRHGIAPTGIYGGRTHRALTPRYSRDQRDALIYIAKLRVLRLQRATVLIVSGHVRLVGSRMGYTQGGGRAYFPAWPRVPPSTDCSGFAIWIAWQSGYGNRVGYLGPGSAVGWTGSLARQGKLVGRNAPLAIGDFVLYGYPPYSHVAVYIGHGLVISHGSPGIKVLPIGYRHPYTARRYIY